MPRSARSLALVVALACASLALAGAGGCAGSGRGGDAASGGAPRDAAPTPTPGDPKLITGNGTIRHVAVEGGFFGIVGDDSARYDPGELDERFRHDGLRVRYDLRRNPGQMSFRMWGTLVTVVRLDSL